MEVQDQMTLDVGLETEFTAENEPKAYEVGYILTPLLPEASVSGEVSALRNQIEKQGGLIVSEGQPEMRRLSYPILKQQSGYFGWMKFILKPDALDGIKTELTRNKNIIRHLIILSRKESKASAKKVRRLGIRKRVMRDTAIQDKAQKPGEIDAKEIDKRLEELVGA